MYTVSGPDINVVRICQGLVAGCWFSPGNPVSSTNKTDHHNITEILLKVALNNITIILMSSDDFLSHFSSFKS
jgi:hypothetical protein